jgi:hypothetical protein
MPQRQAHLHPLSENPQFIRRPGWSRSRREILGHGRRKLFVVSTFLNGLKYIAHFPQLLWTKRSTYKYYEPRGGGSNLSGPETAQAKLATELAAESLQRPSWLSVVWVVRIRPVGNSVLRILAGDRHVGVHEPCDFCHKVAKVKQFSSNSGDMLGFCPVFRMLSLVGHLGFQPFSAKKR